MNRAFVFSALFGFLSGERKVLPAGKRLSGGRGHTRPGWEQVELKITAILSSKTAAQTTPFVLSSDKAGRNVSLDKESFTILAGALYENVENRRRTFATSLFCSPEEHCRQSFAVYISVSN